MTATERQMAADAVALSKEHADRADAAEARWQALRDWLEGSIKADLTVAESFKDVPTAEAQATARVHFTLVSAHRQTLAKMRELEAAGEVSGTCLACSHLWSLHGLKGCGAKVFPAHSLTGKPCPCPHARDGA